MTEKHMMYASGDYSELDSYFTGLGVKHVLLVCDGAIQYLKLDQYFSALEKRLGIRVIRFTDFQPNPLYESVINGIRCFHENHCEMIAAVGGGSAMDVAKCIKLYSNMDNAQKYLKQEIVPNDVPLLAVPTTAGTGSEATRYAVIYYNGEKQSVADESCIPSAVLIDPSVLKTLPLYQKKATMMDALCHAIESYWSVNSTDESMEYSKYAIQLILSNMQGYLDNDDEANANMLRAANIAGRAINITQTTAGHAMCYKLTSLYGIAHGHAAALCDAALIPYMITHCEQCIDPRGAEHLEKVFVGIAEAFNCDLNALAEQFKTIVGSLNLSSPELRAPTDIHILKTSVNPVRLKNHPIKLTVEVIESLYKQILNVGE